MLLVAGEASSTVTVSSTLGLANDLLPLPPLLLDRARTAVVAADGLSIHCSCCLKVASSSFFRAGAKDGLLAVLLLTLLVRQYNLPSRITHQQN